MIVVVNETENYVLLSVSERTGATMVSAIIGALQMMVVVTEPRILCCIRKNGATMVPAIIGALQMMVVVTEPRILCCIKKNGGDDGTSDHWSNPNDRGGGIW
jgi:protein required for attachment to host cells